MNFTFITPLVRIRCERFPRRLLCLYSTCAWRHHKRGLPSGHRGGPRSSRRRRERKHSPTACYRWRARKHRSWLAVVRRSACVSAARRTRGVRFPRWGADNELGPSSSALCSQLLVLTIPDSHYSSRCSPQPPSGFGGSGGPVGVVDRGSSSPSLRCSCSASRNRAAAPRGTGRCRAASSSPRTFK